MSSAGVSAISAHRNPAGQQEKAKASGMQSHSRRAERNGTDQRLVVQGFYREG